ncbi:hypothetical protein CTI12_AA427910 [Artemisia annua]|uniref:Uncharacterized protein n=1 Tax=Artemisia annua TaxID=35608 RepID=A0A2U1M1W4_ARTAN|nr:hypothetical protein CTI12_AA427910 [Artemisia annua]
MAKAKQQKKSFFSLFSIFKSKKIRGDERRFDDCIKAYRVFPSDQDGVHWVAEPGIDRKASSYIDSDGYGSFSSCIKDAISLPSGVQYVGDDAFNEDNDVITNH